MDKHKALPMNSQRPKNCSTLQKSTFFWIYFCWISKNFANFRDPLLYLKVMDFFHTIKERISPYSHLKSCTTLVQCSEIKNIDFCLVTWQITDLLKLHQSADQQIYSHLVVIKSNWQRLMTKPRFIPWRHQLIPLPSHFIIKSNHPRSKSQKSVSKRLGKAFESLITKAAEIRPGFFHRNQTSCHRAAPDALVDDLHTFGFKVIHFVFIPIVVCALTSVFITTDLPPPVEPTIIVQCLVNIVSYNWITLSTLASENKRWREGKKKREWVNRRNKDMSCGLGGQDGEIRECDVKYLIRSIIVVICHTSVCSLFSGLTSRLYLSAFARQNNWINEQRAQFLMPKCLKRRTNV